MKEAFFFIFTVLSIFHKNLLDLIIFRPRRTTIRIRFQRLIASSFGHNVSKGSRQNSTVTLGKGVAQRIRDKGGEENKTWPGRPLVEAREAPEMAFPASRAGVASGHNSCPGGRGREGAIPRAVSAFNALPVLIISSELMLTRRIRLFN